MPPDRLSRIRDRMLFPAFEGVSRRGETRIAWPRMVNMMARVPDWVPTLVMEQNSRQVVPASAMKS